jgi:hypothetical protein
MMGKEEEAMTLRMLDFTTHGRVTGSGAEWQHSARRRRRGLRPEEEEGQLGLGWAERRNWAERSSDLGQRQREWARAC